MIEFKNIKYEITDNLELNVWHIDDDVNVIPPFYCQHFHPDRRPWASREEVEEYFLQYSEGM